MSENCCKYHIGITYHVDIVAKTNLATLDLYALLFFKDRIFQDNVKENLHEGEADLSRYTASLRQ